MYQSKSAYCYCPCCGCDCVSDTDGEPQLCCTCVDEGCDPSGASPEGQCFEDCCAALMLASYVDTSELNVKEVEQCIKQS